MLPHQRRYVFDIETNAVNFNDLPGSLTDITCLVVIDRDRNHEYRFSDNKALGHQGTIEQGVRFLQHESDNGWAIGGQNVHGFDVPCLQIMFPWFRPNRNLVFDSKVESEMWYPSKELRHADFAKVRKVGKDKWIAPYLDGRHSLEAWGARLNCPKDDFSKRMKALGLDPWGNDLPPKYAQERMDYCAQDVRTNIKLFDFLEKKFDYDAAALGVWMENRVAPILHRQHQWGVQFNEDKARKLHVKLVKRQEELTNELRDKYFPPFYVRNGKRAVPKKTLNYKDPVRPDLTEGAVYDRVKQVMFNPGSGQHIARMLIEKYNWKPTAMTPTGEPKCDEDTLSTLTYPCIPLLLEVMMVMKRIGQVATGDQAWLKKVRNGRIHHTVKQNGTRTTRASHTEPNLGQVPKVKVAYGPECRELFEASEGREIVGCDQSGIELRALGHYLARYDGGAYAREAVEGDVHERAREAIEFNSRDNTKTAEYSFLYGAQNPNLGKTTFDDMTDAQKKELGRVTDKTISGLGAATRRKLERGIKGLEPLVKAVGKAYKRGWMRALDGRKIAVPSKHSALNTLLQHLGGELSKLWMVIAEDLFIDAELQPANMWYIDDPDLWKVIQILWVHDELQEDTIPEYAETVGALLQEAAALAGRVFELRVPVDSEYKIGEDWSQTH